MTLKKWIDEDKLNEISPPGTPAAEAQETLPAMATSIIEKYRDEIIAGGVWKYSEAVQLAEDDINAAYKNYIAGGSPADLEAACAHWKKTGTNIL